MRAQAQRIAGTGYRPWAIAQATARGAPWALVGLIPVRARRAAGLRDGGEYVFVRVWSLLLRLLHWSWALLITVLVVTGFEIQTMYLAPETTRLQTGFFFGYVRVAHYVAGWLLVAILVARLAQAVSTSNRYEHLLAFLPFHRRADIGAFFDALGNYLTLRTDEGKKYLGHDPLAQTAFTFVYLLMILALITGLALYGLYAPRNWFFHWFQWPIHLIGATEVRLVHVLTMWAIIVFVPIHIYMVIRADGFARQGSVSAMISGGRWIRKGARLEDV